MLFQHDASTATSRAQVMADALVSQEFWMQDVNGLLLLWFGTWLVVRLKCQLLLTIHSQTHVVNMLTCIDDTQMRLLSAGQLHCTSIKRSS